MARAISSRRAQIEERKAQRNLILALIITLVLGVLFLIFVIPLVFRMAVQIAQRGNPVVQQSDTIPPQRPVFQPPAEFMSSKELTLSGYTEAKAKVELVVDGQNVATTQAGDDGSFSFTQELEEGAHDVLVFATDEAGNISQSHQVYPVTVDTTTPTISVSSPENNTTFTVRSEQTVRIEGRLSEKGEVRINGSRFTTNEDGDFTATWQLGDDENKLEIIGRDQAGNQSEPFELTLYYRP